jgi:hypothetical protein
VLVTFRTTWALRGRMKQREKSTTGAGVRTPVHATSER